MSISSCENERKIFNGCWDNRRLSPKTKISRPGLPGEKFLNGGPLVEFYIVIRIRMRSRLDIFVT
jgi:hypothetical protein